MPDRSVVPLISAAFLRLTCSGMTSSERGTLLPVSRSGTGSVFELDVLDWPSIMRYAKQELRSIESHKIKTIVLQIKSDDYYEKATITEL